MVKRHDQIFTVQIYKTKSTTKTYKQKKYISYAGGRLVCEFAYIRQGETESDEVNRFPSGQTHVGFAKLYTCISSSYSDKKSSSPDILYILRCLTATEKSSSPGNCIRVASIKIRGRQYYSLTALISVLTSRNPAGA